MKGSFKALVVLLVLGLGLAGLLEGRRPDRVGPAGYFEGEVAGVVSDALGLHHTVVLVRKGALRKDAPPPRALLITVGGSEGASIATGAAGKPAMRPLSHDLLYQILNRARLEVEGVHLHSIHKNTYFGRLVLRGGGELQSYDCRPSDCLAVALRARAPIWISDRLFMKAAVELNGRPGTKIEAAPEPERAL